MGHRSCGYMHCCRSVGFARMAGVVRNVHRACFRAKTAAHRAVAVLGGWRLLKSKLIEGEQVRPRQLTCCILKAVKSQKRYKYGKR